MWNKKRIIRFIIFVIAELAILGVGYILFRIISY